MPDEKKAVIPSDEALGRPSAPLIFISHDTRDAELAEAFSKLLSSVSAGVLKSFRSSDRKGSQGIEYGVEWYPELMSKLSDASDVVCLLTQNSLDRPWLLYEAGVAKGKLNTPVYGVALGIPLSKANAGPFAQFQNCDDDEESLTKLVTQLVRRIPGSEPDHDAILMQVKTFKTRIEKAFAASPVKAVPVAAPSAAESDASVAKLFEEVKVMFQDLPSRIERRLERRPSTLRRWSRMNPMMLHELSHSVGEGPGDPTALLVMAGFLREDMPWLYEIALEAYRSISSGDVIDAEQKLMRFRRAFEVSLRGPMFEDLAHSREASMFYRELPMLLEHLISEMQSPRQQKVEPKPAPRKARK
jgi:hypothetical protein